MVLFVFRFYKNQCTFVSVFLLKKQYMVKLKNDRKLK